jgi:hypothetical protein
VQVNFVKPYLAEGRVEIPVGKYLPAYKENLKALRRAVQMPGFRPGHVPLEYVRGRYGKETLEKILTREFFTELERLLGEGRVIGLPFFAQEPPEVVPDPPYKDYSFTFQVLVRPAEPPKVQGAMPPLYKYEPAANDLEVFRRYLRMLIGEFQPLEQLPSEIPAGKELYVKLQLLLSSGRVVSISWVSFLEPFPYSSLAGRRVGEEVDLPPSYMMPYVEIIRSEVPDFSPLSIEKATLRVRSASLFTPASDAKVAEILQVSEITEEGWRSYLEREVERRLRNLNERSYRTALLEAAGIEVPAEVAQVNYLYYLRVRSETGGAAPLAYEDFAQQLGWRVFLESHLGHVPDLEVSDEEVETDLWEAFKARMEATEEGKALLAQAIDTEDKKQALLQSLLDQKHKEDLRTSLRYERFEKWLAATYGPRPEKALPLQTILLAGL